MLKTTKQVISGYHRPVCPECQCEMRPETNGVGVLDYNDNGPYAIYDADLWKCPRCGKEVIGGFGQGPIARHHDSDFGAFITGYRNKRQLYKNYEYKEGTEDAD